MTPFAETQNTDQRKSHDLCALCGGESRLGFVQPSSFEEIWLCDSCADKLVCAEPITEVEFVE